MCTCHLTMMTSSSVIGGKPCLSMRRGGTKHGDRGNRGPPSAECTYAAGAVIAQGPVSGG